ncbi:MAG: hypothetical protein HY690_11110, partial [Chloroflexi bacterium]|nr:hypothetical protein [Chloroflexota bacterium]
MSESLLLDLLAQHPFTFDLSDADRHTLAASATVKSYAPDELLIHEGRAATAFFLLVD